MNDKDNVMALWDLAQFSDKAELKKKAKNKLIGSAAVYVCGQMQFPFGFITVRELLQDLYSTS